jgi:hypothetical protein
VSHVSLRYARVARYSGASLILSQIAPPPRVRISLARGRRSFQFLRVVVQAFATGLITWMNFPRLARIDMMDWDPILLRKRRAKTTGHPPAGFLHRKPYCLTAPLNSHFTPMSRHHRQPRYKRFQLRVFYAVVVVAVVILAGVLWPR